MWSDPLLFVLCNTFIQFIVKMFLKDKHNEEFQEETKKVKKWLLQVALKKVLVFKIEMYNFIFGNPTNFEVVIEVAE